MTTHFPRVGQCAICSEPASIRYGRRFLPLNRAGPKHTVMDLCPDCDTTLRACLAWVIPQVAAQRGGITRLPGGWRPATTYDFMARKETA